MGLALKGLTDESIMGKGLVSTKATINIKDCASRLVFDILHRCSLSHNSCSEKTAKFTGNTDDKVLLL